MHCDSIVLGSRGQDPTCRIEQLGASNLIGKGLKNPVLSAKAAESRVLLFFAYVMLGRLLGRLGGVTSRANTLLQSLGALNEWYGLVLSAGPVLPEAAEQRAEQRAG